MITMVCLLMWLQTPPWNCRSEISVDRGNRPGSSASREMCVPYVRKRALRITGTGPLKWDRHTLQEESIPSFSQPLFYASSELGVSICVFSFNPHRGFENCAYWLCVRLRKMMTAADVEESWMLLGMYVSRRKVF